MKVVVESITLAQLRHPIADAPAAPTQCNAANFEFIYDQIIILHQMKARSSKDFNPDQPSLQ